MDTLSRYSLDIWNSPYSLDVLNFRGEEQLSETFSYTGSEGQWNENVR